MARRDSWFCISASSRPGRSLLYGVQLTRCFILWRLGTGLRGAKLLSSVPNCGALVWGLPFTRSSIKVDVIAQTRAVRIGNVPCILFACGKFNAFREDLTYPVCRMDGCVLYRYNMDVITSHNDWIKCFWANFPTPRFFLIPKKGEWVDVASTRMWHLDVPPVIARTHPHKRYTSAVTETAAYRRILCST